MVKDKKNTAIYTVSTINYLEQAVVALNSVKRNNNFKYFFIFLVDIKEKSFNAIKNIIKIKYPWISLIAPHHIKGKYKQIMDRVYKVYSILEICSLSKFIVLKYLSMKLIDSKFFVYIDTDLYFFSNLDSCFKELVDKTFFVTPHLIYPYNPFKEVEFLISGYVNAGFFICNASKNNFIKILDLLIERISTLGFFAPKLGLYCDQNWFNLIINIFSEDFYISQNPGYNLAYWNIEKRIITKKGGDFYINNNKLIFFHFSGFSRILNRKLSIHSDYEIIKRSNIDQIMNIYKSQFKNLEFSKDNIKLYKFNKSSLNKRIKLMGKELNCNLFEKVYKERIFSNLGNKIDKFLSIFL